MHSAAPRRTDTGTSPLVLLRGAVAGGSAAAAVTTAFLLLLRAIGLSSLNLELLLGSALTRSVDGAAWLAGFGVHLSFGVLFALLYGAILQAARRQGAVAGAALGVVHALVSGFSLPIVLGLHPLIVSGVLANPGFFARNLGLREVAVFLLAHIVYGAVVGALVRPRRILPVEPDTEPLPRRRPLVGRR
ncbi:MAG TPA: hypothetical protein VEJ18_00405 [Planctomycetota bacterium]|nr:hypothetical protein [Planctomycetota bacterium]